MYEQSLIQAGLSAEMAQVYELLLKTGPLPAGKISKKTGLKRGLAYKTLDRLLEKQLITKFEENEKVAVFTATHPLKLQDLIDSREQKVKNAKLAMENVLPNLVSDFNLLLGKPDVVFYEGEAGIEKVVFDSLSTKGEIYQYIDNEAANKYFSEINARYTKKRKELDIKKKMITVDGEYIRKNKSNYDRAITDIHLIDGSRFPFAIAMQIYDNKISYLTMTENKKIGIIIDDQFISRMHKTLFEYTWEKSVSLFADKAKETNSSV